MDDRTRLFHLIQMVKTLELEYEDHDDDDCNIDGSDEGYLVADSSDDGCGDPDKDIHNDDDWTGAAVRDLNGASLSKPPCVRRRLDFSCATIDHHQEGFSHLEGCAHVSTSHSRNFEPGLRNVSTAPVKLEFDAGRSVLCSYKGNRNHSLDVHRYKYGHHTANTKTDIMERNSMYSSHTRLSPMCASSHKPRPETVTSVRLSNKQARHKNRKGISRKEKLFTEISSIVAVSTPVYESKRTAGYNYGLPLNSPPTPNKK